MKENVKNMVKKKVKSIFGKYEKIFEKILKYKWVSKTQIFLTLS